MENSEAKVTEVQIGTILVDPNTNSPIVVLKSPDNSVVIPVWIGAFEAGAIASEIEKLAADRPMTHDLTYRMLRAMDANIESVLINDLRENTYFAQIKIASKDGIILVDARPSDAIALAMRADAAIYVSDVVVQKCDEKNASKATEILDSEQGNDQDDEWADVWS